MDLGVGSIPTREISMTFRNALQSILLLSLGVGIGWWFKPLPKPVKEVVEVQATDEQLLAFWFGPGDKAKLRKRVCNGK